MFHFSYSAVGTLMMDTAAICFLGGILVYTSMYRQRGRLDDKLFFAMILITIIMAVTEEFSFLILESGIPVGTKLILGDITVLHICFTVFPLLFLLYQDYRIYHSTSRLYKNLWLYSLPCLCTIIMIFFNLTGRFFFSVTYLAEEKSMRCIREPYYFLIFINTVIYCLQVIYLMYRVSLSAVLMLIVLVAARIGLGIWIRDISSTVFTFTLLLAYTHIIAMNQSFYEEDL